MTTETISGAIISDDIKRIDLSIYVPKSTRLNFLFREINRVGLNRKKKLNSLIVDTW